MTAAGDYDLLVIGGGINGVAIARDAAGRGLRVLLCEQNDLASGTSSASSKLAHGGLRYLETREFGLVRESLAERETLRESAPHLVWPLRFILPVDPAIRPAWMIALGLFLYDRLAGGHAAHRTERLDLHQHGAGTPLKDIYRRGFAYFDCWADDARLVVMLGRDAADHGATILTRTACVAAHRQDGLWQARLAAHGPHGTTRSITARAIANVAGPWVGTVGRDVIGQINPPRVRLVKGSHIVVPRLSESSSAYILQAPDRRVVFVLPFERNYSLIGTTDIPFSGDPAKACPDADEIRYLCDAVGRYFRAPPRPEDVVWRFAGVRALVDDGKAEARRISRDYALNLDTPPNQAPLLTVIGGKLTTHRSLAEAALGRLLPALGLSAAPWTRGALLPGGDLPAHDPSALANAMQAQWPWLPPPLAWRFAHAYGTRALRLLEGRSSLDDLGEDLGGGLHRAEVDYLCREEWAREPDDILWRRTKIGLHAPPQTAQRLATYLNRMGLNRMEPG
ncbi:MAG: glycerol-3-phosphate dehydrogenase [Alphaproteobacteria bacterium]